MTNEDYIRLLKEELYHMLMQYKLEEKTIKEQIEIIDKIIKEKNAILKPKINQ